MNYDPREQWSSQRQPQWGSQGQWGTPQQPWSPPQPQYYQVPPYAQAQPDASDFLKRWLIRKLIFRIVGIAIMLLIVGGTCGFLMIVTMLGR